MTSEMDMCAAVGNDSVIKSPNDKKDYRVVKLENGLTALLIKDVDNNDDDGDGEEDQGLEEEEEMAEDKDQNLKRRNVGCCGTEDEEMAEDGEDESLKRRKVESCGTDDEEIEEEEEEEEEEEPEGGDEEEGEELPQRKNKNKRSKMAAAALCVGIGSFSDPDDIPGFAHFLEHMVFMGSAKYPCENSFDAFIQKHGGSDNAATGFDKTVFQFEIQKKHFREGLDRFAQFFTEPLLKQDSTDRELEAVDSEFQMSVQNDYHRKQQMMSVFCKEGHPMGKFTWGNSKSLKVDPAAKNINVHERLKQFRKEMYSSHYMTLVVQSKDSLDDLEQWVRESFSNIPNNGLEKPSFSSCGQPFQHEKFHKLYKVIPVQDEHTLDLTWSLPSQQKHYRCKPLHYLGWLLGHEGQGSIMALLKKRALALRLFCGNSENSTEHNETYAAFNFNIVLSDEGLKRVNEVLVIIFQYINMLHKEGPQKRIFDEIKTVGDNTFRFFSEMDPIDNVDDMSERMHLYPPQEYITGPLIQTEYKPQVIKECTDYFSPETANIIISSKEFIGETDQKEEWFGTEFTVQDIPEELMANIRNAGLNPELYLPTPNKFIATEFELKKADVPDTDYPTCILDNGYSKLWYRRDTKFNMPRASMYFHLMTPLAYLSPKHAVTFDLFVSLLEHQLTDTAYEAEAAELNYTLKAMETGLEIRLDGFDHKLPLLFKTIVEAITNFNFSQDMFVAVKENLKNSYHNYILKPAKVCRDLRLSILQKVKWTAMDKNSVVQAVSSVDVMKMAKDFRSKLFFEALVQGNFTSQEVKMLEEYFREKLCFASIPEDERPVTRVLCVPGGSHTLRWKAYNESDTNTVITNYFQAGPGTVMSLSVLDALTIVMEEPCFHVLRTQQQLGYTVHASMRNTFGVLGFAISVHTQASKFSASYVDGCMDAFLKTFSDQLDDMPQEDFKTQMDGLINMLLCEDASLLEESDRNWGYVINQEYTFDRIHRKVEVLRSLTLNDIKSFLMDHIHDGTHFRKLSVQVIGYGEHEKKNPLKPSTNENTDMDDVAVTSANQNGDEMDSTNQSMIHSEIDQSESRVVPQDEGMSGVCITDIGAFKQDLSLLPVSKIDH
ncbi:nardilysin-like [Lytechinus pictus]|uniref:nardilysin-like n=1 Tax=Lytechinus pictus TaxID=7653 RepID=UPI0030B9C714